MGSHGIGKGILTADGIVVLIVHTGDPVKKVRQRQTQIRGEGLVRKINQQRGEQKARKKAVLKICGQPHQQTERRGPEHEVTVNDQIKAVRDQRSERQYAQKQQNKIDKAVQKAVFHPRTSPSERVNTQRA